MVKKKLEKTPDEDDDEEEEEEDESIPGMKQTHPSRLEWFFQKA
jgi:hypothetical protein